MWNSAWNFRSSWPRFLFPLHTEFGIINIRSSICVSVHKYAKIPPITSAQGALETGQDFGCPGEAVQAGRMKGQVLMLQTLQCLQDGPFFFFFWNFLKFSEAFAAPQSQPPDSNWVMEITSDRSLPEQKMWGPECPKNHQASPHCQWRWSRGRYWTLILLPRCICKVHRCPHNPLVCSGNTLSKKGKKKCKSAQKLLLPSWKLKEIMASKWGRNLQRRIWAFAWQGKVLQKVSVA